jgi:hypothetical protein
VPPPLHPKWLRPRATRLDGLQEPLRLDDLEFVVTHRHCRRRLKGRVFAITGTDVPGRHRLILERHARPDAQLTDPAEIPTHDARCAVDLEPVGVLLTHRDPAGFQRAPCA